MNYLNGLNQWIKLCSLFIFSASSTVLDGHLKDNILKNANGTGNFNFSTGKFADNVGRSKLKSTKIKTKTMDKQIVDIIGH